MSQQAIGQLSILCNAEKNEEVLKDVKVKEEDKKKIRLVKEYKTYFYEYFNRPETEIYSKTTMLDRKAVTYLVITSPKDKIEAQKECFPFIGCFPYIGFFSLEKANEYAKDKQEDGFSTWLRPVYAYSTLGYFTDTILSSFFQYSDEELAEVIFHELFHTIFFPKNEVALNENMASYFARKMKYEYFQYSGKDIEVEKKRLEKKQLLRKELVEQTQKLNKLYDSLDKGHDEAMESFLKDEFLPQMTKKCEELALEKCYPVKRKWNNAMFAAFLTYEQKEDEILLLHKSTGGSLKEFLLYLEAKHQEYESKGPDISFTKFLLKKK